MYTICHNIQRFKAITLYTRIIIGLSIWKNMKKKKLQPWERQMPVLTLQTNVKLKRSKDPKAPTACKFASNWEYWRPLCTNEERASLSILLLSIGIFSISASSSNANAVCLKPDPPKISPFKIQKHTRKSSLKNSIHYQRSRIYTRKQAYVSGETLAY